MYHSLCTNVAAEEGFEPSAPPALRGAIEIFCEVSNPRLRQKKSFGYRRSSLAAEEGFEPSQTESESGVLPLHKPAKRITYYMQDFGIVKEKMKNCAKTFPA